MIRPALISLALATGASASPLDREGHVYTPDMTLGEAMELGIVPEPVMQPRDCAERGPWYCAPERPVEIATIEWPKAPTPEELLYGPRSAQPASAFAYFGPGPPPSSHRASNSMGGVFVGGGSRHSRVREGDRLVTIYEKHVHFDGCDCGCCDEPEPVPLPGAAWLLIGALGLLWRMRR